jgi:hypothetical protein
VGLAPPLQRVVAVALLPKGGESLFTLTPTSSSTTTSTADPESPYQITYRQFLAFFYEKLTNCTIDIQDSVVRDFDPTTKSLQHDVFHFATNEVWIDYTDADNNKSVNTSRYADGYLSKVDRYYDSYTSKYDYPASLAYVDASELLETYRKGLLERFFMPFLSMMSAPDYPDAAYQSLLSKLYASLTYSSVDHSYSIPDSTSSSYGLKSLRFFCKDGNLLSLTSKRRYSEFFVGDTTTTLNATFSAVGSTTISWDQDIASKYTYHEVTCYDDSGTLLLGKVKAIDGQAPVITFPLVKNPSDDSGAYAFNSWDQDVSEVKSDLTVKAKFDFIANADLYDFNAGILSVKVPSLIGSLVVPSTFTVNGVAEAVTGISLDNRGSELSKIKFNPTMTTLSIQNTYFTAKTVVDLNGNPNFKFIGKSLYSADGSTLYRLAESDTMPLLSFPSTLKVIGPYACFGTSATGASFPSSLTRVGAYAFATSSLGAVLLPEGVTSVGAHAFENCESLLTATLPESLVDLPASLFDHDYALRSYQGSSKLLTIGDDAFEGTLSLSSFTFPDSLTKVGDGSFSYSGLTSVRLSANGSAWENASQAFYLSPFLTSVYIPKGITKIPSLFLDGALSLTSVTFEADSALSSLGEYAFAYCNNLGAIDLSALTALTSIGSQAFIGDYSLTSVKLPNSLTTIEGSAFALATSLKSIVIPTSVTSIKAQAFYGDSALSLYLAATTLPSFDTDWNLLDSGASSTVPSYLYSDNKPASSPTSYWHYVDGTPTAYTA